MYEVRCRQRFSGNDATMSARDLIQFSTAAGIDLGVDLKGAIAKAEAHAQKPVSPDLPRERRAQLLTQQQLRAESHVASVARQIDADRIEAEAKKRIAKIVKTLEGMELDPHATVEEAARAGLADEWVAADAADREAKAIWQLLDSMREHGLLEATIVENHKAIAVPALHRFGRPTAVKLSTTAHSAVKAGADVGYYTAAEAREHIAEGRHLEQPDTPSRHRFL